MGQDLSKLDIIALSASGAAAEKLRAFLAGIRADVVEAIAGGTSIFHQMSTVDTEGLADATDLPGVLLLANALKAKVNVHLASTVVHLVASSAEVEAAAATDQSTANTLLNEIKADYTTHLDESGVHLNDDGTNTVAAADATDLATSITLANELKADYNAHVAAAMSAGLVATS